MFNLPISNSFAYFAFYLSCFEWSFKSITFLCCLPEFGFCGPPVSTWKSALWTIVFFQDPSAWRHLRSWGTVVSVCWVGSASHWPLLTMSLLLIFSYFVCCLVPGDQATDGLVLYWWPAVHVEVRMLSNLFDKQVECLSVAALCTLPVFWFCRCLLLEPLQALC